MYKDIYQPLPCFSMVNINVKWKWTSYLNLSTSLQPSSDHSTIIQDKSETDVKYLFEQICDAIAVVVTSIIEQME